MMVLTLVALTVRQVFGETEYNGLLFFYAVGFGFYFGFVFGRSDRKTTSEWREWEQQRRSRRMDGWTADVWQEWHNKRMTRSEWDKWEYEHIWKTTTDL
jgi:hypothetical protein